MRSYLDRWNTQVPAIEGASQRVHEDTQRFAAGIHSCVSKVQMRTLSRRAKPAQAVSHSLSYSNRAALRGLACLYPR